MKKIIIWPLFAITLSATAAETPPRWYGKNQVQRGEVVFQKNCISCHGEKGVGTPDWREQNMAGKNPPPPLNGTAHTWHHPLKALRKQIRDGGQKIGGAMPPFRDSLNAQQIDDVIAYFQSLWTDDIYQAWLKRGGTKGAKPLVSTRSSTPPVGKDLTQHLRRQLGDANLGVPETTPFKGVYQVPIKNEYVYLSEDGRYVFLGEMIDLVTGANLTRNAQAKITLEHLKGFAEGDMAVYPAEGKEQAALTIFTDTACPYCRKLHAEVPQLQKAGVKVRYIPFPRGGKRGPGYNDLKKVWCSADRATAMNIAKDIESGDLPDGNCEKASIVDAGYRMGNAIGLQGTPLIIFPNGKRIDGYQPAAQILAGMGIKP